MPSDKRKPKRPKAMRVTTEASTTKLPRPRRKAQEAEASQGVATQAVSKLRANRRKKETWAEGYAKWEAKRERVRCPHCEKLVPAHPNDTHTCYDAKALRELPPSPIAGQPLDGIGSAPLDVPRAIPCGEDVTTTTGTATPDVFRVMFPEPSEPWYELAIRKEPNARIIVQFVTRSKTPLPPEFQAELRQRFQSFLNVERDRIKAYEDGTELPPPDTSAYPWPLKAAWWLDGVPTRVRRWLAARLTRLAEWVTP